MPASCDDELPQPLSILLRSLYTFCYYGVASLQVLCVTQMSLAAFGYRITSLVNLEYRTPDIICLPLYMQQPSQITVDSFYSIGGDRCSGFTRLCGTTLTCTPAPAPRSERGYEGIEKIKLEEKRSRCSSEVYGGVDCPPSLHLMSLVVKTSRSCLCLPNSVCSLSAPTFS